MNIKYLYNKSSIDNLSEHLRKVDDTFFEPLSMHIEIDVYAQKLFTLSNRIEAWDDGVLVGLVAFYSNISNAECYVTNVSVLEQYTHNGIASTLLFKLDEFAKQNEISKIVLESYNSTVDFYKKCGYNLDAKVSICKYQMIKRFDKHIPVVSVCCLVYNHDPYLRQCFDGFVMQKTTFPIEILVHDDASTDHSADIIREYTAKYPDIFKPIYQTENQYSKGVPISATYQIPRVKGKYIAFCEGDDYWTDPLKLQKQVDFLETHEDFSMCCHRYKLYFQKSDTFENDYVQDLFDVHPNGFSFGHKETVMRLISHTSTIIFRTNMYNLNALRQYKYSKDVHLVYHLLLKGQGYYFPFYGSVYRKHNGGIWSILNDKQAHDMYHRVYQEILDKNPNDNDLREKVLSIIKKDLSSKAQLHWWTYNWIKIYLKTTRRINGVAAAIREFLYLGRLWLLHIIRYSFYRMENMRLIAYLKNQIWHDRNVRLLFRSQNEKLNHIYNMMILSQKIDFFREKALNSVDLGVSSEKLCGHDVIVSLTTFGNRIHNVYLAIESIMQGSIKPNKIVLWLAEDEFKNKRLPKTLQLQQERGLEICFYKNIRSYLKLIPSLERYSNSCIITIDDDVIYEYDLIERLINAHVDNPDKICACRMHRIVLGIDNKPIGYLKWNWCIDDELVSPLNFPTGVGGVLYPPQCFTQEVFNDKVFMDICSNADDIWFYAMALLNGTKSIWVKTDKPDGYYYSLPLSNDALALKNTITNNGKCGNDTQLENVFNEYCLYKCFCH